MDPITGLERTPVSRRAHKVPNGFFIAWGLVCLAALTGGPWMLISGLRYRESHQEAEAMVVNQSKLDPRSKRRTEGVPHLKYEVEGKQYDVALPPAKSAKERQKYREHYYDGKKVPVWYPIGNPQAAEPDGDHGVLLGGTVFTGAGVLFSLVGALAVIAEFFPNRYVRFG
jgi:hypothetical protein